MRKQPSEETKKKKNPGARQGGPECRYWSWVWGKRPKMKCLTSEHWPRQSMKEKREPGMIHSYWAINHFSSVQSLSCVLLFATQWIAAHQASLSITNSWSSLKLMSIESVIPSSHLILCHPLFLLLPIPPSTRVFSNESTLHLRWPKYWSFSFSIIPSKEHPGLISFRMDWLDLLAVTRDSQESSLMPQFKSIRFFGIQLSLKCDSHIHTWLLEEP